MSLTRAARAVFDAVVAHTRTHARCFCFFVLLWGRYIPGMLGHDAGAGVEQQAFSFGDYLSAQAYWKEGMPVSADEPQKAVIWLHPYSYNTGYAPAYGRNAVTCIPQRAWFS